MSHTAEHTETDDRVGQAVEQYFDRVSQGDKPVLAEFVEEYADIADVLKAVIPALEITENKDSQGFPKQDVGLPELDKQLGDFRVRRQIGRGGMGVVYEADQISMGRRVALKVLPLAGLIDEVRIQRFQNEVRAVAALDHPNIVSIYMVGEDRGIHYYAMQLIRGRSLAEVVDSLRRIRDEERRLDGDSISAITGAAIDGEDSEPLSERTVSCQVDDSEANAAETVACAVGATCPNVVDRDYYQSIVSLGIQAAEALQHAHDQGVIHRDIKPSNLLLDCAAKLFVTDFGLARVGTEASVTITGDMVGTLRYMAPEQALAKRVVVDGRADIYSLGVTLYELLTLHCAFAAEDRQALLKQIAFEDPAPMRRIDRQIPQDLETIIGKATAKDPDDRYATMESFANDLKAVMDNRPIKAKPPTLLQYATKWTRRHRAAVAASLTACVAVVLCLIASTVVVSGAWLGQRQATQVALSQRDEANYRTYVADMRLAGREWFLGDVSCVLDCLDDHEPDGAGDSADYRGWEWYFLSSLCHQAVATVDADEKAVNCAVYSPDGTKIATAGHDQRVRIWDAGRLADPTVLANHQAGIRSIVWSPDGRNLASGSFDGTIVIWDVARARSTHVISAEHPDDFQQPIQLAWSPDGKTLAGSVLRWTKSPKGRGRAVVLWKTDDWSIKTEIVDEPERVQAIAWKPDSSQLALGGNYRNKRLVVWDVAAAKKVTEIESAHRAGLRSVAWSPDGNYLATAGNDRYVKIWNTSSWEMVREIFAHKGDVWSVAWRPDGQVIASGGGDAIVKLWNVGTGELVRDYKSHLRKVMQVSWNPGGTHLASASSDHTVKVWSVSEDRASRKIDAGGKIAITRQGGRLAASSRMQKMENGAMVDDPTAKPSIGIYDVETGQELRRIELDTEVPNRRIGKNIVWSPDGTRLAAPLLATPFAGYGAEREVAIWKVDEHKKVKTLPGGRFISWSPDGMSIGVSSFQGGVKVFDVESADVRADLETRGAAGTLEFSPQGQHLAVYDWTQRVHVWDANSWYKVAELQLYPDDPQLWGRGVIAWSHDGKRLAAVGQPNVIVIWDPFAKKELARFRASASDITGLAFSPDGSRLASGGRDGVLRVWDTRTSRQMLSLVDREDSGTIKVIRWSPDGRKIICGGWDGVNIWDASIGYDLAKLE